MFMTRSVSTFSRTPFRTFLNDLGGNPNKRNGANETSLHAACRGALATPQRALSAQERRAACVLMLLQWRGPAAQPGAQPEKVDVDALDKVRGIGTDGCRTETQMVGNDMENVIKQTWVCQFS